MALKIRLRQQGRNNRQFYRLVVTDVRSPRDGKYTEQLGWYNPFEAELDKSLSLNEARIKHWLLQGAEISERAVSLVKKGAPQIVKEHTERAVAHKAKMTAKRKARKKAAA